MENNRVPRGVLSLPANRESFVILRNWLCDIIFNLGVSEKIQKKNLVAADEVFINISCYAYPAGGGTVDVSTEYDAEKNDLILTFSDSGIPFNPLMTANPDLDQPAESRPIGGLGVFLVRQFMDDVEYQRENDRNHLVLRKKFSPEAIESR